jgi:hypothetical protein
MSKAINQRMNATARVNELAKITEVYKEWTGYEKFSADSKEFKSFNRGELKTGRTNTIGFSDNKIYNRNTDRFINRSTVFTNTGSLRAKYDRDGIVIKDDVILDVNEYLNPIKNCYR